MKRLQKLLLGLFVFGIFIFINGINAEAATVKVLSVSSNNATVTNIGNIAVYVGYDSDGIGVSPVYYYTLYYKPSISPNSSTKTYSANGQKVNYTVNCSYTYVKCVHTDTGNTANFASTNATFIAIKSAALGALPKTASGSVTVNNIGTNSSLVSAKATTDAGTTSTVYVGFYAVTGTDYIVSSSDKWTSNYDLTCSARKRVLEGYNATQENVTTNYLRQKYTLNTYKSGTTTKTNYRYEVYSSDVYEDSVVSSATTPGSNKVTVTYAGLTDSCYVTWYKKDLESITATYNGGSIVEGLTFKPENVTINIKYNNGTTGTKKGDESGVSFSTTTVSKVGSNSIKVYFEYTGDTYQKKEASITVTGLEKDLVSISTKYVGPDIVEEMPISAGDVEIVMTFNNNTKETYRANAPKQSPHNSNVSYAWINNDSGTTVYSTKDGTDNFMTTRWSVNKGSMTFTVYNEYYGTKSVKASNTITVPVLKKTPVSVDATYPEEILVVEGLEFDNANVTIAVTYDNGTVYTIDANGLEKSGYTNGYVLDIYNTYASSTDYDDYIGENASVGESWDTIVYNVGENRFIVDFTENEATVYDDFYVIGEEKTAVNIEATYYGPDVTMGLAYLPGNVEILVTYDNGTVGTLKGNAKSITLTNEDGVETTAVPNLGVNTYYAQFQECTDDFEVVGKEAVLTSIYVLLKPKRAFYTEEDAFDPTGMIVMATYSDYTEEMVQNSALDLSDGDSLRAGQEFVMIGYTVGDVRKETSVEVFVDIGTLTHLTIEQEPNKLEYDPGEDFDPTGMVVIAHYSTGKTRTVGRTEYTLVNGENLQSGQSSVTIRLEEDGFPADVEQIITVRPKMLVDIEILRKPNKTNYFPGQNFSTAGMAVMAVYSDDSKKVVTDSCTVLDGTSLPLGKNTVTITYTELVGDDPITISKTIDIIVADATVNNISAIYMGGKIKSGEAFSPSDVMVTINYTNGEKTTVDGNYDGITFSTLIVKTVNNTVTVAYRGHTCVIKIPVLNDENNENQSITEIVSKSTWKEFFTVKKTRAVEDYYYSGEYKIPYIRKGVKTQKPLTMDIQFKLYAIEMGGWTSWYNSGELVSTGNAPATNLKVGLLNAPDITLNAIINGKTYNDINSTQEFTNPQTISFTMTGSDDFKLQYKASYNGKSTDWVDEGTMIGIPNMSIEGISFRIVKKK